MSERTTLTSLPPELFLTIFSHLPQRTIRTTVSPLETTIQKSPSKRALQDISFSSSYLRDVSNPFVFQAVGINSLPKLKNFLESGAVESVGRYVKRLCIRWDSCGQIFKLEQQASREVEIEETVRLVSRALVLMPNLRSLQLDFPGAFEALELSLSQEHALQDLQLVNVRNGCWEFGRNFGQLIQDLGRLRRLRVLTMDGNGMATEGFALSVPPLKPGSFSSLETLSVCGLSTFCDRTLENIVGSATNLTSLSIRNCASILLSGTRRLLVSHGHKLRHLSLEVLKSPSAKAEEADRTASHHHISEDEHICPVIRDCCPKLKILDLFTDKICKEVLFPTPGGRVSSGTMTGGLPTPPGSPELATATVLEIPTPPVEALNDHSSSEVSPSMLPPPLFNFALAYGVEHGKSAVQEKRDVMKSLSLRIPYDPSCFGVGSGGPSLQQTFTKLCDGMPAKELLEIGMKAFEEGLVEVVKVTGHWKGGPYLIMKD